MLNASNIITTIELNSALCITLSDETRHYFGGYYHVKVLAYCDVPLEQIYFDGEAEFIDARNRMGESVRFERILEKMAVPEPDIAAVLGQLVDAFNDTALGYLSGPDFAGRLVRNEYGKCMKKSINKLASRV